MKMLLENVPQNRLGTVVANLALEAGTGEALAGSYAHRAQELHKLMRYPQDFLGDSPRRYVEQPIVTDDGKFELDNLFRNSKGEWVLGDYKPVHLDDFLKTNAGQEWEKDMIGWYGDGYQEKIISGQILPYNNCPEEKQRSWYSHMQAFLEGETAKHKEQLAKYAQACQEKGVDIQNDSKHVHVLPYFVFRKK